MKTDDYFTSQPDGPLYHYTGIASLIGMTTNRQVWAGHIRYMNDSQELVHAIDLFDEIIETAIYKTPHTEPKKSQFLRGLKLWIEENMEMDNHHLYVFSLSQRPSLLSQWRSYTPHGKGVSIGFPVELLRKLAKANNLRLGKCQYSHIDKWTMFESLIDHIWTLCRNMESTIGAENPYQFKQILQPVTGLIIQILALAKHEAFSEEEEWRLISPYYGELGNALFREGTSMLTPYLPLHFGHDELPFEAIIMGPAPHEKLALPTLKAYCAQHRLTELIVSSEIPYRVW